MNWHLIGDFFYKRAFGYESHRSLTPLGSPIDLSSDSYSSSDEFLRKIDEEFAKQKRENK